MKQLSNTFLRYFVFGNFFIAFCAIVMFWQTQSLFLLKIDKFFYPFVFCATICSYSLHWYLTPSGKKNSYRSLWSLSHSRFLFSLVVLSAFGTGLIYVNIARFYKILIPLALLAFGYTAPKINARPFLHLRKIYIGKTIYLALMWTFVTVILPIVISDSKWNIEMTYFALNRFFLIFPLCILFDLRDKIQDEIDGIKNIVIFFSEKTIDYIFIACVMLNIFTAIALLTFKYNWIYLFFNIAPMALLTLSYTKSKRSKSDLWYYVYLDGLMMLSGLMMIISGIL